MHPLIRVVTLLVFIAGISLAQPLALSVGFGFLLITYLVTGFPALGKLALMIKRLRWLLVAILLVYGWWTPGEAVFSTLGGLSPSLEGLNQGFLRVLALISIAAAVHLLLQLTGRQQLIQAIIQFIRPFSTQAARTRFAVRLVLTLEAVPRVQPLVDEAMSRREPATKWSLGVGRSARSVYVAAIEKSGQMENEVIGLQQLPQPAFWQWLIPCIAGCGLWAASL